jgi:hypothetical protein
MSVKGKGKQCVASEIDGSAVLDTSRAMEASVRFTDSSEDLRQLWVGEREPVREVKRRVWICPIEFPVEEQRSSSSRCGIDAPCRFVSSALPSSATNSS